jgi:hypothetical protein
VDEAAGCGGAALIPRLRRYARLFAGGSGWALRPTLSNCQKDQRLSA